jgi:hypothetical protein
MALAHVRPFESAFIEESAWYWPVAPLLSALPVRTRFPSAAELSALYAARTLGEEGALPLRFVEVPKQKPRKRPKGPVALHTLYEGRIAERGEVSQRPDDWHDLFNALAFIAFPRAKAALHLRQYNVLRSRIGPQDTRLPGARTREQDALSLFDEGGVAVIASPEAAHAIDVDSDDCSDTVAALCQEGRAQILPFGHALYEHLVAGLPCPLAMPHVVVDHSAWRERDAVLRRVDRALAANLQNPAYFQAPARCRGLSLAAFHCTAPPPLGG